MEVDSDDSEETSGSASGTSSLDDTRDSLDEHDDHVDIGQQFLRRLNLPAGLLEDAGYSPLMIAAWHGYDRLVHSLLANGAPVDSVNPRTGETALILAAVSGMKSTVDALVRAPDIDLDRANRHGDTALMLAVSHNHPDVVASLLEAGADVNLVNRIGDYSALSLAARYGWSDIARQLLAVPGIQTDWADNRGDTALILACAGRHAATVQALLEAKADVAPVDRIGYTAFSAAVSAKSAAIVELFLAHECVPTGFQVSYGSNDPFDITVADLLVKQSPPAFAQQGAAPLDFFNRLNKAISDNDSTDALTKWLCDQGIRRAGARGLAVLLAPAHAWARKAAIPATEGGEQQQLI